MSSSDEEEPFQLRDYDDEDTDDERPNKRRKTVRPLRGKGIGFVSATIQANDEEQAEKEDEDEEVGDERPRMGLGMGGFPSQFNIGEYAGRVDVRVSAERDVTPVAEQPRGGTGPSAFTAGGKVNKNSFAARIMAKQGYVEGQGLGKSGQGIAEPIQAIGTSHRAGLGAGTTKAPPPRKPQRDREKSSKPSTPGAATPRLKAPPKTKYTVSAIESRGLHVPETIKSVIIDATGPEKRTIQSLSGLSTPATRESTPALETSKAKASTRVKLQLQAFAEAWDSITDALNRLELEEKQVGASIELYSSELDKFQSLVTAFERVNSDDSSQTRVWADVVARLDRIQTQYSSYIDELELAALAVSCLETPLGAELAQWDALRNPTRLTADINSLAAILDIERTKTSRSSKRTTPYASLLVMHWYPHVRTALKSWSIYNPEPAYNLITSWQPLLPSWLVRKTLSELILPALIAGVYRYPKLVPPPLSSADAMPSLNPAKSSSKSAAAPDLHSWLFDWWSLLSSPDLDLEQFPQLRSAIKEKVTVKDWPVWKPLLGSSRSSKKAAAAAALSASSSIGTTPTPTGAAATTALEVTSFKEQVEEWCAENNLLMRSTNKSDPFGRLLYRLQDATSASNKGILVYLLDDVIFSQDGQPFGLDDVLLEELTRKKR